MAATLPSKGTYPICDKCDHILNPNLEDDCDAYYVVGGEKYCQYCFTDWLKEYAEESPEVLAAALNIIRVEVAF